MVEFWKRNHPSCTTGVSHQARHTIVYFNNLPLANLFSPVFGESEDFAKLRGRFGHHFEDGSHGVLIFSGRVCTMSRKRDC